MVGRVGGDTVVIRDALQRRRVSDGSYEEGTGDGRCVMRPLC